MKQTGALLLSGAFLYWFKAIGLVYSILLIINNNY